MSNPQGGRAADASHPALRVLSLGAGVQSTTVLLLALAGELPPLDAVIFADTGWEPRAVYTHLDRLRARCADAGLPLHVVSNGNIRDTERQQDFYDAPYFLLHPNGAHGMARRQCTHQLKLVPIRRKVRELLAERGISTRTRGVVEQWIGISLDEWQRAKDSDVAYVSHRHPLLDLRWTRQDCERYLAQEGWAAPRSACIGCPYHSDAEWRALRDHSPDEFADAAAFEREIQGTESGLRGTPYLHAQRVPLDEVDLRTREDAGQLSFAGECEGLCGV